MIVQHTMIIIYCTTLLFVTQAFPLHQLEGEALDVAERNGFLSDDYDKLQVIKLFEQVNNSFHPLNFERIQQRRWTNESTILAIRINGINYTMVLRHSPRLLHKNVKIVVDDGVTPYHETIRENKGEQDDVHPPQLSMCHLVGYIVGHKGGASVSYCNGFRGFMIIDDTEYIFEPLEDGQILVAERKKPRKWQYPDQETSFLSDFANLSRKSRNLQKADDKTKEELPPVVIEMALYCDEPMTAKLEKAKANTIQKKVDYMLSKFNGVQYEFDKIEQLQRTVIFQIKKMVFFKKNPEWLVVGKKLHPILVSLCKWTAKGEPYDIVYMITGLDPVEPIGRAWIGGACRPNSRCGISRGTSWGRYIVIAHEIGHLLGLFHDSSTKCKNLPSKELGLMGGKGTDFSKCSVEDFLKNFKEQKFKCLFKQNIPDDKVMKELRNKDLGHIPSVWNITHHQYCENLLGPGYRYREKEGMLYSCERGYFCIQLKEGRDFGVIYQEMAKGIVGMYCAPGKVCLKGKCLPYTLMTLHTKWIVRPGGWGDWSDWTLCSRTCGTGVKYRHRECDNPTPIQHAYCVGNEYEGKLCNTDPCPGDSSDEDTLIKSRADETCKRLVEAKIINPKVYKMTGHVYGKTDYDDICDVYCDNIKNSKDRVAILPDGTPCTSPDPDSYDGPEENIKMYCFRGRCQTFGCDKRFPAVHVGKDPKCRKGGEIIG